MNANGHELTPEEEKGSYRSNFHESGGNTFPLLFAFIGVHSRFSDFFPGLTLN